jgi:hypothetical protein
MPRRLLTAALLVVSIATAAQAQSVDNSTDYGYRGFEGNEETVGSKVDDPAKVRLTAPITTHGGGGGVVSFSYHVNFGEVAFGGRQTEMAMLRVEQAEDVRGSSSPKAEFNFLCNDGSGGGDAAMQKCLSFTWTGITRISPYIARDLRAIAAGAGGGGGSGGAPASRMESPNGRYWLQLQDDGNYVIYDAQDPAAPKPIFDLWWLMFTLQQMGKSYPR